MKETNITFVGTKDDPIKIYWDPSDKKTDEYLLILSICSGAYGDVFLDVESFKDLCARFFRYAKKDEKYNKQFQYVLNNAYDDCSNLLKDMLLKKWNLEFEYNKDISDMA